MGQLMKHTARLRFIRRPVKIDDETKVGRFNIILQQQVQIFDSGDPKVKKQYWADVPFFESESQANMSTRL